MILGTILLVIALAGMFWAGMLTERAHVRRCKERADEIRAKRKIGAMPIGLPSDYKAKETIQKTAERLRRQTTVVEA